ncbi:MAG: leucyl/phenylalanyl-tRNA--protein transferase [Gammaproteobacteria bacterium]|nr:MAG: leucyl/phenylalanyl-tRNA--protein transferase [Gammaproteobacteria bacterium]
MVWLDDDLWFPPPELALREPNGLLCAGGDLSLERLRLAYGSGIFPWYEDGQPLLWWSPDPRCLIDRSHLHVSRSLKKWLRKHIDALEIRIDTQFEDVVKACAAPRHYSDGTWITAEMQSAYLQLHRAGIAHSFELWRGHQLVGGLYGVSLGRSFFGESMFSSETNASKLVFAWMVLQLSQWSFLQIDCQLPNAHLMRLGAFTQPRAHFLTILKKSIAEPDWHAWTPTLGLEAILTHHDQPENSDILRHA